MTIFGAHSPAGKGQRRHKLLLTHRGTVLMETSRLLLRPFRVEDAETMFRNWAGDPRVTRYLLWRAHQTVDETRSVLEYWQRQYSRKDFYEWGIVLKDSGQLIGSVGATKAAGHQCLEVGYCIGYPWWGRGICPEALYRVMDFFFCEVGCRQLIAMHAIENPSSGRVMEKCGMVRRPGDSVPVSTENGLYNCRVYEMTRQQFELQGCSLAK